MSNTGFFGGSYDSKGYADIAKEFAIQACKCADKAKEMHDLILSYIERLEQVEVDLAGAEAIAKYIKDLTDKNEQMASRIEEIYVDVSAAAMTAQRAADEAKKSANSAELSAITAAQSVIAVEGIRESVQDMHDATALNAGKARVEAQKAAASAAAALGSEQNAAFHSERSAISARKSEDAAIEAMHNANQAFVSGGMFKVTADQEYPDITSVTRDTLWIVQVIPEIDPTAIYTFTSGQLVGKSIRQGWHLVYDTPENTWHIIPTGATSVTSVNGHVGEVELDHVDIGVYSIPQIDHLFDQLTAEHMGALPIAGGTMRGEIKLLNDWQGISGSGGEIVLRAHNKLSHLKNGEYYKVYTEEFKPTAADVGAYTSSEVDAKIDAITPSTLGVSNPNLLINGDFSVWQRGGSGQASYGWMGDRWTVIAGGISGNRLTINSGDTKGYASLISLLGGSTKYGALTKAASDTYDYLTITQRIEHWGTFVGKKVTVSGFFRWAGVTFPEGGAGISAVFDKISFRHIDGSTNLHNVETRDILFEDTGVHGFYKFTCTLSIPMSSKASVTCGELIFWLSSSNREWTAFNLASVKMELGTVATPFVPDDPVTNLAKCQRYYNKLEGGLCWSYMADFNASRNTYGLSTRGFQFQEMCKVPNVSIAVDITLDAVTGSSDKSLVKVLSPRKDGVIIGHPANTAGASLKSSFGYIYLSSIVLDAEL